MEKNEKKGTIGGLVSGAIAGGKIGAGLGIAAGPLGAISGLIPGILVGGIVGGLSGNRIGIELDKPKSKGSVRKPKSEFKQKMSSERAYELLKRASENRAKRLENE